MEAVCVGAGMLLPLLAACAARSCAGGGGDGGFVSEGASGGQRLVSAGVVVTALQDHPAVRAWMGAAAEALGVGHGVKAVAAGPHLKRARYSAQQQAQSGQQQQPGQLPQQQQQQQGALLLLSEPRYGSAEGALPWAQLRCWGEFEAVR